MMAKRISQILFIFTFSVALNLFAAGTNQFQNNNDYLIDGDSFVPIPWGKELPISLGVISGSWMLRQGEVPTSYFTFKIMGSTVGSQIIFIQQMDPSNCVIMSTGVGNLTNAKVIYATLRNLQTRQVYRLNIRNFSVSSFVKKIPTSYEGNVVVLSIAPINSHNFNHFSMARVFNNSNITNQCRERLR